jgi:4-amino-4-deoxy-L-arabinose transferase-like glycosyltransferase
MKSLYHRITRSTGDFLGKYHLYVAGVLLAAMFGLGLHAMAGNSAIVDEVAHIPAGYSYLHYGDYRLNPEHPPLIKDLAGLPLQFMPNIKFPDNQVSWTTDINGQWESGWNFLYHIGNDADSLIFWSRLPLLLLAIIFGGFLYWFVRRKWGTAVALLVLLFYAFSPNIIAHSALVTTDLGATVFMFLAIAAFARFIDKPSGNNLILLSLALAGAQLAKFSSILLYPLLGLIALGMVWVGDKPKKAWDRFGLYVGGFISASAASLLWIWAYYIPHTWNMPAWVQDRLINGSLVGENVQGMAAFLGTINDVAIFKPLAQYLLGLQMVFVRVDGGNVTYFNGEVTNQSFHWYFPELFLVKTQVPLLILTVVVAGVLLYRFFKNKNRKQDYFERIVNHFKGHHLEWTLGIFAAFYFAVSVAGNLNLGIRHILPVYVPLFVLVAVGAVQLVRRWDKTHWRKLVTPVFALLIVWYAGSTVLAHPSYLSYFNELIGGPKNADKYFSDSSVDWGQDLRRLKEYVDSHPEIDHIAVDYFGGGVPAYYFCQRKYDERGDLIADASGYDCSKSKMEEWHSHYGTYTGQYIAVSETFLVNDKYYAELNGTEGYQYLRDREPIAKIGYSIHVYKLY